MSQICSCYSCKLAVHEIKAKKSGDIMNEFRCMTCVNHIVDGAAAYNPDNDKLKEIFKVALSSNDSGSPKNSISEF